MSQKRFSPAQDNPMPRPTRTLSLLSLEKRLHFDAAGLITGMDTESQIPTFEAAQVIGANAFTPASDLVDVDNDGDLDAFIRTQSSSSTATKPIGEIWLNDGAGHFTLGSQIEGTTEAGSTTFADFDADGDLDLFVGQLFGNSTDKLYVNDGLGRFTLSQTIPLNAYGRDSVAVDLEGDGDLDLVTTYFASIEAVLNNGDGTFQTPYTITTPDDYVIGYSFDMGDIDGDGDMDLMTGFPYYTYTSTYLNDGAGHFTATHDIFYPDSEDDFEFTNASFLDLDGDADLDLVVSAQTSPTTVWLNNGDGRFTDSGQRLDLPVNNKITMREIIIADFDVDGDSDFIAMNGQLMLNDGAGYFSDSGVSVAWSGNWASAGDVNGDGAPDLLIDKTIYLNSARPSTLALATDAVSEYREEAPAVTVAPDLTITASGQLLSAQVAVTSGFTVGEDLLTAQELPAGITASWDGATGILTLTGQASAADYQAALRAVTFENLNTANPVEGVRTLTISLVSGAQSASDAVSVTVLGENDAPTLSLAPADQTTLEDAPFSFTLPAGAFADVDTGDVLTLSASDLPAWLSFDPATATFSGNPGNDDVGGITVTVTATDAAGAAVSASFALTVENVNDAPTVTTTIPPQSIQGGHPFTLALPATLFADVDRGDTLTLTTTTLPAWLSFDAATNTFSGTPHNRDHGAYTIQVTATDQAGATATTTVTLTVVNGQGGEHGPPPQVDVNSGNESGHGKPVGNAANVHSGAWIPPGRFQIGNQLDQLRRLSRQASEQEILDQVFRLLSA